MDGPFFVDSRAPHMSVDCASVTLSTTAKAIIPVQYLPILGSNYFGWQGKAVRLTIFGRLTTGTTPGNGVFSLWWGTGADANGTTINGSQSMPLTASMTGSSFIAECIVRCRAVGTSGALMATGQFTFLNSATLTSAGSTFMIPGQNPAAQTLDLTQNFVISPQFLRSGSTAESIIVHDTLFEALN